MRRSSRSSSTAQSLRSYLAAPLPEPAAAISPARHAPFEPAVLPFYAGLVRRLVLVLGDADEAQDVAQDAYLQAFRALGSLRRRRSRLALYHRTPARLQLAAPSAALARRNRPATPETMA
jgi:hypothetical protein